MLIRVKLVKTSSCWS